MTLRTRDVLAEGYHDEIYIYHDERDVLVTFIQFNHTYYFYYLKNYVFLKTKT
jgi:hypothetical protein